jgi:hypothetical protein
MVRRATSSVPIAAAYGWAILVALMAVLAFHRDPPPRFGDLYLLAVCLVCAHRGWKSAALLLAFCIAVMVLVVWPLTETRALGFVLFALSGAVILWVIEVARSKGPGR